MRRALFLLLACVLVVAAAVWIGTLPGAARFEAGSLAIDASTPVLVFAAALALGLFYGLLRLAALLVSLPRRLRASRAARRRRDGDTSVTRALVALAAGHQTDAVHHAARARKQLGDTPHTLLIAAQAHRLAGREDDAAAHFTTLADHKDAALLGLRGLLRQAIAREDWAEATAIADRAERAYPNSSWLREERARLAVQAGDWKSALALSGPGAPVAAYSAAAAAASTDPAEAQRLARAAWKADPGLTQAALAYAAQLPPRKSADILRQAWTLNPHPDLAAAYLAGAPDAAARYQAARSLTADNSTHPESQLLLGRTALDANDLAAARTAADATSALNQHRAWALIAEVESRIAPDSAAVRTAWQRAATAAPDPQWRCTACHHQQPHWSAKCSQCGTAGSLRWG